MVYFGLLVCPTQCLESNSSLGTLGKPDIFRRPKQRKQNKISVWTQSLIGLRQNRKYKHFNQTKPIYNGANVWEFFHLHNIHNLDTIKNYFWQKKKKKRERLFLQYSSIIIYMLWENKKHTVLLSSVKIDFMAAPGTAFMELNVLSHGTFWGISSWQITCELPSFPKMQNVGFGNS